MVSQKQAVTNAVKQVRPDYELNSDIFLSDVLTDSDKKQIREIIVDGFLDGEVEMSAEAKTRYFSDRAELTKYVTGLVNNWVRKNPEFNGGSGFTYTAKNPGSRQGTSDETIRALKALLKMTVDPEAKAEIQAAINLRLGELKPKPQINVEAIPAHLRHLIG